MWTAALVAMAARREHEHGRLTNDRSQRRTARSAATVAACIEEPSVARRKGQAGSEAVARLRRGGVCALSWSGGTTPTPRARRRDHPKPTHPHHIFSHNTMRENVMRAFDTSTGREARLSVPLASKWCWCTVAVRASASTRRFSSGGVVMLSHLCAAAAGVRLAGVGRRLGKG